MTDKELRKLGRPALLALLLEQAKEYEELEKRLEAAEEALKSRQIQLDTCGSIAEAALKLNGVFEAAQKAAAQYEQNAQRIADETVSKAKQEAEEILRKARQEAEKLRQEPGQSPTSKTQKGQAKGK